jgi:hypothetical protein
MKMLKIEYDKQRLKDIVDDIENDWNGKNPFIQTLDIEKKAL